MAPLVYCCEGMVLRVRCEQLQDALRPLWRIASCSQNICYRLLHGHSELEASTESKKFALLCVCLASWLLLLAARFDLLVQSLKNLKLCSAGLMASEHIGVVAA